MKATLGYILKGELQEVNGKGEVSCLHEILQDIALVSLFSIISPLYCQ